MTPRDRRQAGHWPCAEKATPPVARAPGPMPSLSPGSPSRRAWLQAALGAFGGLGLPSPASSTTCALAPPGPRASSQGAGPDANVCRGRALEFPRDHGAHPDSRIEWWYATGWLARDAQDLLGFQLTFFRSRTGLGAQLSGRLAPRQLLFAHAALTQVRPGLHRHAQRAARWSGEPSAVGPWASSTDTELRLGAWHLRRTPATGRYQARLPAPEAGFTLEIELQPTQPLLLQGEAGWSAKGPPLPSTGSGPAGTVHASHYYSLPQLKAEARLSLGPRTETLSGKGWLDHEWSDALMPPAAVGWDWIGINLADGGALTAFVLRDRAGQPVWAGGSLRRPGGPVVSFEPGQVRFTSLREWTSPATGGRYPVHLRIETPAGRHELVALLDAQELDGRSSTGTLYWEGLAELRHEAGGRAGLGYLEMTGRAQPLRLP